MNQHATNSGDSPQQNVKDSPLCARCRALNLDELVGLQLEQENLQDTIWNYRRPHTWRTDWCDGPLESIESCDLCLIIRFYEGSKLGAHSARTLFKTQLIPDITIFEIYFHTTTLLVPEIEEGAAQCSIGARDIDPLQVDYNLLRQWLGDCSEHHGAACVGASNSLPGLKVIDCQTRKVISAPELCKYAALSYLWGQNHIVDQEQQVDGDGLGGYVPRVVEDALIVCRQLGIQYLWVDKYCIDQTDATEKHQLIRQMDRIYNGATLAIIAAAGDDAEYGLPGVSGVLRKYQPWLHIGGIRFLAFSDSTDEIRCSKWASRAWTYQEGLLSRRRLVFTQSQVYFQCMESHCWEGLAFPWKAVQPLKFYQVFPDNGIGTKASDIIPRLNEYASRQLSYGSDILNAFLGIFHPYQSKGVLHCWGLPFLVKDENSMAEEFMMGLGWNTRVPEIVTRRERFPSWSWVGWEHIDNLTLPWAPDNCDYLKLNQGLGFAVKLSGPSGIISLRQYAVAVLGGSDFTDFAQRITVTGPSSECIVKSAWDVGASLPPEFRRKGVMSIVRMMGIPETNYGSSHHSPLNIVYLGCYRSSGLFFSFFDPPKVPGF